MHVMAIALDAPRDLSVSFFDVAMLAAMAAMCALFFAHGGGVGLLGGALAASYRALKPHVGLSRTEAALRTSLSGTLAGMIIGGMIFG